MADKKKRPILTPGKPGSSKMGDAIAGMIKDRVLNAKVPNKPAPKDTQGSSTKERRMLDTKTGSKDTPPQRRDTSAYPAPPKRSTAQAKK
jgi:hypothetical protein